MILFTIGKAASTPYAPSRQHLSDISKKDNRPSYFVQDNGKWKINIDNPEWVNYLKSRAVKNPDSVLKKNTPRKPKIIKPVFKNPEENKYDLFKASGINKAYVKPEVNQEMDLEELIAESNKANLEEQILKNEKIRYQNEQEKLKLKKEAGDIIDFKLAEFLFFGYMEKMNIELLMLTKKIKPIINNLVQEKDTDGIIKRFNLELETILIQIKKAQQKDLEKWENE